MDHVQSQHAHVSALFDVEIGNVAPIADKVRQGKFVVGRNAQEDRRVALLVLVADGFIDLSIERRDAGD